ncbi:MAG TPA: polymer-forming cytoskeletal protein [Pyrinomonadaceae bacterium]|nr:polymer-forming cytoskeletal protein [Pyrinomonadaceae bacterium]
MKYSFTRIQKQFVPRFCTASLFFLVTFLFSLNVVVPAQTQLETSPDEKTLIVNDAPDMEVYAIGKSVIVKNRAKGVLAFGGDVIIEGRVEGDVAAIGGSIIQKENAYVGGDIIVFGGSYKPEAREPLREKGKETVMFGAFEEELRDLAQNPSQILAPTFSLAFLAQRLLSVLFWFVVTLAVATIAPGAVSRSVARFHLSTLKVVAIGFVGFVLTTISVIVGLRFLPDYLSVILGLMVLALLMLAYVFGRVALQVTIGKLFLKHLVSDRNRSETLAILTGVLFWTVLLSIPYIWTLALITLFAGGIGLVLTARAKRMWPNTSI